MSHLPLGAAIGLGLRALVREAWLAAVGLVVSLLRRAAAWPAVAVAWLLLLRGAVAAFQAAPFRQDAPLVGMAFVATRPRAVALVLGLWLAGALAAALLRLAWLAGALPTLAGALGDRPGETPRFADGVAHVTPRLLPVAALAFAMELTGGGFALALGLASLRISEVAAGEGIAWLAAPVALALVLAIAVPLALGVVADAALVRAAVRGEGPATSVARAVERFVRRPSALLLAALLFSGLGLVSAVSLQAVGQLATGFAPRADLLLLLGPRLMLAVLGSALAAALELWWLASLTALVTVEE